MRILILDDNEIVVTAPEEYSFCDYRDDELVQTANVKTFVDKFFREEWDEVWIDHDLGRLKINGRTATKEIYNYILGSGRRMVSSPYVKITTMNPSAAMLMEDDIRACGLNVVRYPISYMGPHGISRGGIFQEKEQDKCTKH